MGYLCTDKVEQRSFFALSPLMVFEAGVWKCPIDIWQVCEGIASTLSPAMPFRILSLKFSEISLQRAIYICTGVLGFRPEISKF